MDRASKPGVPAAHLRVASAVQLLQLRGHHQAGAWVPGLADVVAVWAALPETLQRAGSRAQHQARIRTFATFIFGFPGTFIFPSMLHDRLVRCLVGRPA